MGPFMNGRAPEVEGTPQSAKGAGSKALRVRMWATGKSDVHGRRLASVQRYNDRKKAEALKYGASCSRLLRSRLLCLNHRGTVLERQRQSFDSIQSSISNPHPAEPAVAALETVEGAVDEDALGGDDGEGAVDEDARCFALLVRILLPEAKAHGTPSIS